MKRAMAAAIAVAAAGLVSFVAPADGATTTPAAIIDFAYQHGECGSSSGNGDFSITVGDTITWVNCGQATHTVTGTNFGDTTDLPPGATYARTFSSPGTFPYHCDNHPTMTGTVTVAGEPTTTTPTTPATTATTARPATTTTRAPTTTTTSDDIGGVFTTDPTTSTTPTTTDPTVTTRALGQGGDGGTSAGLVAMLILGLGAVGTAGALLVRRIRTPGLPPD